MARKYFYDTGDNKVGPVTGNDLVVLRARGEIDNDTWVRRSDSSTWRPLGSVNLREEEEEEANPGLLKLLLRHVSLPALLLTAAVIVVVAALFIGILSFAWPIVLLLFIIWMLGRAIR